jgi:hypothetical protein
MTVIYKKIATLLSPQVTRLKAMEAPSPGSPFLRRLQELVGASPIRGPQTPSGTQQLIADSERWLDRLSNAMDAYQRSVSADQSTILGERDDLQTTLDELQREVQQLRDRVTTLDQENAALLEKVSSVEAQWRDTSALNEQLKEEKIDTSG